MACATICLSLDDVRHGLRVSEAVSLQRDEVDVEQARSCVRRLKNGLSVERPIAGDDLTKSRLYGGDKNASNILPPSGHLRSSLPHRLL